jgi:hypothetical protein
MKALLQTRRRISMLPSAPSDVRPLWAYLTKRWTYLAIRVSWICGVMKACSEMDSVFSTQYRLCMLFLEEHGHQHLAVQVTVPRRRKVCRYSSLPCRKRNRRQTQRTIIIVSRNLRANWTWALSSGWWMLVSRRYIVWVTQSCDTRL